MALKRFLLLAMVLNASAAESTNVTVVIAGKQRTLAQVESMIREHAKKTKIHFEFEGAKREVSILTNSPGGVFMTFRHPDSALLFMGCVDKKGKTWTQATLLCGGIIP